jgi:CRP/FNR family transcriptional regulator, dissimilatory nitrate respiration regulator
MHLADLLEIASAPMVLNGPAKGSIMSNVDWLPQTILALAKFRDLRSSEVLFREGDAVSAIYEVVAGRIRMVRHTVDDHVAVLHTAGKGEIFGEAALFSKTYHCDAVASVPTRVRAYPKRETLQAILGDARLAANFMSSLAHQIQDLRTRLEQRNIRSARGRVTQFLRLSADAQDGSVQLKGTLMDLAGEVGLSHEALYRTLAALESEHAIARSKNKIVLLRGGAV